MRNLFLITVLILFSPFVSANIFFDDFDGDDLADWWTKSEGTTKWDYEVSDSMLKVKRLWGGPFEYSQVHLNAVLPLFNDFEMTAKVGWDLGLHQILRVTIYNIGYETPPTGGISYYNLPDDVPRVQASFNGKHGNSVLAPNYGMHVFRFVRKGFSLSAYFNGELIDTSIDNFAYNTEKIQLTFVGKDVEEFAPLYFDMVQVVPEPSSIAVLTTGLIALSIKRRRKKNVVR